MKKLQNITLPGDFIGLPGGLGFHEGV